MNNPFIGSNVGKRRAGEMIHDRTQTALRLVRPDMEVCITPLYAPDDIVAELVLGQRAKLWSPELVRQLEREGLPPCRRLFGRARYVPAVFQFFARREGLHSERDSEPEDGPENFGSM